MLGAGDRGQVDKEMVAGGEKRLKTRDKGKSWLYDLLVTNTEQRI